MKSENWFLCHGYVFSYFGDIPRLLVSDNCRTATKANNRLETVLNRSYQELADYYGTTIVPARVPKADNMAAVEGSVRFVSTWTTAALRDRTIFPFRKCSAVAAKLDEINLDSFQNELPPVRL